MTDSYLSAQEELDLITRAQDGDCYAYDELFDNFRGLIWSLVKKYYHISTFVSVDQINSLPHEIQDAFAAANLGFSKAVKRFDTDRNNRFSTYVTQIIEYEIADERARMRQNISIPEKMERLIRKYFAIEIKLTNLNGIKPSHDEIISEMGCSAKEGQYILNVLSVTNAASFDIDKSDDNDPYETIASKSFDEFTAEQNNRELVHELNKVLTPFEREVLSFYQTCLCDVSDQLIADHFNILKKEAHKVRESIKKKAQNLFVL